MTEIYTLVDSNRRIDEYIKLRLGRRTKMQFPLAKLIGAKGTLKLQAHKGFIITLHDHRNAPARWWIEEATTAAEWPRSRISSTRGHCSVCAFWILCQSISEVLLWVNKCFHTRKNCKCPLSHWLCSREVNKINRVLEIQETTDFITFSSLLVLSEFEDKIVP